MDKHLLNLRVLADANVEDYALLGFEGREELSRPFEYQLELITNAAPVVSGWIGKLAEFDIFPDSGEERVFAGRIYAARRVVDGDIGRVFVTVRPAYHALAYARATHFVQDMTSTDIFEAMTADVPGLQKSLSVSPAAPKRGYAVRYDESEIDFLDRLLAQDGIMYFFKYGRNSGPFRHDMVISNQTSAYVDIAASPLEFKAGSLIGHVEALERHAAAGPYKSKHTGFNVNKLDTPFQATGTIGEAWGQVYAHEYEAVGYEALADGNATSVQKASDGHGAQGADHVEGHSTEPSLMAGGRAEIKETDGLVPRRVVFTRVIHSARDPWMFGGAQNATYRNSFSAIDATQVYRPPVDIAPRRAPGPVLGEIKVDGAVAGEIKVDKDSRVPVVIANARVYDKFGPVVWLPVQQQWSHATHGAQFFPRIGTRVIIDFLYGNPDLPFISGCVYTPSHAYPFDPASHVTQSGWRSVTEKNGGIKQEFYFEDKDGSEEIKLYTGRDYRREIDQDDWGTVKRDQTLEVQRDRKRKVTGKETVDVQQTRTVTVDQKYLMESKQEIQIKVGSSSITLKPDGITIEAMKIESTSQTNTSIKANVNLELTGSVNLKAHADAMAELSSPMTTVKSDATTIVKGGIVMIN